MWVLEIAPFAIFALVIAASAMLMVLMSATPITVELSVTLEGGNTTRVVVTPIPIPATTKRIATIAAIFPIDVITLSSPF